MPDSEIIDLPNRDYAALLATMSASSVQTEYEVLRLMRQTAAQFDFSHFMITRMPGGDRQSFVERLVLGSWPADLVRQYDLANLFPTSRLMTEMRHTKIPVFSETAALFAKPATALPGELSSGFEAQGMSNTFAAMLHTTYGESFVVALFGRRAAPAALEAAAIYYILLQLFERLERSMDAGAAAREKLSARELECLRWAAAGKSSDEIAIILGISTYTVSSYFKTAARKLDAVNRMQAIARALRLKLI